MEQLERIAHMEQILDDAIEAVSTLTAALEKYNAVQDRLQELITYYDSAQWHQDFEDDNAGKIPRDLKRGVLSEDAVYNLLEENQQILKFLSSAASSAPQ